MINVISSSRYPVSRKKIAKYIIDLLKANSLDEGVNVNVVFVGRRKMKSVALEYKNEDVALPVLAFPYNDKTEDGLLGEIVLCYPQVVLLAAEKDKKVDDMIMQLVEHGFYNLLKG